VPQVILKVLMIMLYENVFQNPELFPTQVSLYPEHSTLDWLLFSIIPRTWPGGVTYWSTNFSVTFSVQGTAYWLLEMETSHILSQNIGNVLFLYSWKGGNGFSTRMVPKLQITSGEATSDL
jgi:hypothetical protein